MLYVPVMRYRQEERAALHNINFSEKTVPLIEIIREKPDSRMKGDFASIYQREISSINATYLMIDFPTYIPVFGN